MPAVVARLLDGTEVTIRSVRPEDKQLLVDGFNKLSAESRYRRFLGAKDVLSARELAYLTEVDGVSHVAIGAVHPDGAGLGIARFIRSKDDPTVAEAAITVLDAWQGKGLGKLLLERLTDEARARGVTRFRCEVLAGNERMLGLLDEVAPDAAIRREEDVVVVEVPIPPAPPAPPIQESPIYRLLRLFVPGRAPPGR